MAINARSRGRHYTIYGLSEVDSDGESATYCRLWVIHANVNEEGVVTASQFEESKKSRKLYAAADMRFLSVRTKTISVR